MLESRITLGLQAGLVLFTLGLVHIAGSVFGSLGIISDLFIVIGGIQTARFFLNETLRNDVYESLGEFLNLNDVAEFIADSIKKNITDDFNEEDLTEAFKSMFMVNIDNNDLEDSSTEEEYEEGYEEEILEEEI